MKVMMIGVNAKEQALACALERTGNHQILVCPGNPGTVDLEQSMEELPETYHPDDILSSAAQIDPDCIVILDEYLIRDGWKDKLASRGWNVIAPDARAAALIDNKALWGRMMQESAIPVADFRLFDDKAKAMDFISQVDSPYVFKELDGAKRFGVPYNADEGAETLDEWFGEGDMSLMISEFVEGERFNLPVFVYKDRVLPLLPYVVIRGVYENEDDPQSKGMGTLCAPDSQLAKIEAPKAVETILVPFVKELTKKGIEYNGILSGEFVATPNGPVCVNLKAGLSETGACALSVLMDSDLLEGWQALVDNEPAELKWADLDAVSLVLAGNDYPQNGSYDQPIAVDEDFDGTLFYNHAKQTENGLQTDGGRVLIVAAAARTLGEAAEVAREDAGHIHCDDLFFRSDIGRQADERVH